MIQRPCLACGCENDGAAAACSRCGRALSSWVERLSVSAPTRAVRRLPSRTALLALALLAAIALAFGPRILTVLSGGEADAAGPTWREPGTVAAWAGQELHAAGVEPVGVDARVEKRSSAPRRLVVSAHPTGQALLDVVRATARFLLLARDRGEATATHLAIVRQGTRALLLPIGDAARVAGSDEAAATWLDQQERLRPPGGAGEGPVIEMGPEWPPPPSSGIFMGPPLGPADGLTAPRPLGPLMPSGPAASATQPPAERPDASRPVIARGTPAVAPPAPAASASAAAKPASPGSVASPVRVLRSTGGSATASRAQPGQAGIIVLRAQIHPGTKRQLRLDGLTLRARGTLNDVEDVAFVDLVRDADRDGRRGPGDVALGGRQSFTDDDGTVSFEQLNASFGEDGLGLDLLFLVELGDESLGGTMLLVVQDQSAVNVTEVSSNNRCGVRGVPLTGPVLTVEGNVEPDPEQARLDALAEAGPDAPDEGAGMVSESEVPGEMRGEGGSDEPGASGPSGPSAPAPSPITPISPFPRRR